MSPDLGTSRSHYPNTRPPPLCVQLDFCLADGAGLLVLAEPLTDTSLMIVMLARQLDDQLLPSKLTLTDGADHTETQQRDRQTHKVEKQKQVNVGLSDWSVVSTRGDALLCLSIHRVYCLQTHNARKLTSN